MAALVDSQAFDILMVTSVDLEQLLWGAWGRTHTTKRMDWLLWILENLYDMQKEHRGVVHPNPCLIAQPFLTTYLLRYRCTVPQDHQFVGGR